MQIWPNGESPCIWMEAGIIDFKLCDRNHNCDDCPFNEIMRRGGDSQQIDNFIKHTEYINVKESGYKDKTKYLNDFKKSFDIFEKFRRFTFNPDIYYGSYYWYVKLANKNIVQIGLNDNAIKMLPPLKDIIISQPDVMLKKDQSLCWLFTNIGSFYLKAPLNGKVTRINPELLSIINTFNENQKVWILELFATDLQYQIKNLVKGVKAKQFLIDQQNLIINTFKSQVKKISNELGPTLQDGGIPLFRLENVIGPHKYLDIIIQLFHDSIS